MRFITWNSVSALLLDDKPNFAQPYELTCSLPAYVERGETGREARIGLGDTPRLSLKFSAILETQAVSDSRNALQSLNTQPVLVPLWVAKRHPSDTHPVSAAWYAVYRDGQLTQVYASGSVPGGLSAADWVVPVMVGILSSAPNPQLLTSETWSVDFEFTENTSDSLTLDAYLVPTWISVGGTYPRIFPWRPNLATVPKGAGARVTIDRQPLGHSRATADAFWSQPSYRPEERYYTLQDNDPWNFIRYFQDNLTLPSWLRGEIAESRLSADVTATQTSVAVDTPSVIGANSFAMLDDGTNQALLKVTGTTGSTWSLAYQVGYAFSKDSTQIFSLLLARFDAQSITLRFEHDTLAQASVKWREVPWETTTPAGETPGVTTGATPTSAYLYAFSCAIPGATQTYLFTDFERSLTYGGNTYAQQPFEHGDIIERIGLERQRITIKSRAFTGNPLLLLIPFQLEVPLMVEIIEVDVSGSTASNPRTVFYGEVASAKLTGPFIEATAESMPSLFERKVPRVLMQPTCNWALFDGGCGLNKSTFEYLAKVVSWTSSGLSLVVNTITLASVAQSSLAAHLFAGGYAIIGTGSAQQFRLIGDNAVQSGANLTLTLGTALWGTIAAGTDVKLYPGCDGRYATCSSKFSNASRFGGFPFMPIGNPSFIRVSKNASSGGKK